jgi:hypothetical protein
MLLVLALKAADDFAAAGPFSFAVFVSFMQFDPFCLPKPVRKTETGSDSIPLGLPATTSLKTLWMV